MSPSELKSKISSRAEELGFDLVGFAPAVPGPHSDELDRWLQQGFEGEMSYMRRDPARRKDPRTLMPNARSVVVVAMNYFCSDFEHRAISDEGRLSGDQYRPSANPPPLSSANGGIVARYARGKDYHEVMRGKLDSLAEFVRELSPDANTKVCVDTSSLLERELAQMAGVGFVGRSTMLISRRLGTWFFLGEILTSVELEADEPSVNLCGTCCRCIDACPTRAIVAPFRLDARRCISYLTIELKGTIPIDLRKSIGTRVFGCDDCLEVCPWNRFAKLSNESAFHPLEIVTAQRTVTLGPRLQMADMVAIMSLDDAQFGRVFGSSPLKRIKRRRLVRNICVALGNMHDLLAVPALSRALCDAEPLVRAHAAWALGQIGGDEAVVALGAAIDKEEDTAVHDEIINALLGAGERGRQP